MERICAFRVKADVPVRRSCFHHAVEYSSRGAKTVTLHPFWSRARIKESRNMYTYQQVL